VNAQKNKTTKVVKATPTSLKVLDVNKHVHQLLEFKEVKKHFFLERKFTVALFLFFFNFKRSYKTFSPVQHKKYKQKKKTQACVV